MEPFIESKHRNESELKITGVVNMFFPLLVSPLKIFIKNIFNPTTKYSVLQHTFSHTKKYSVLQHTFSHTKKYSVLQQNIQSYNTLSVIQQNTHCF